MKIPSGRGLSRLGPRGTFGMALLDAAKESDRIVGLTADLAITSGMERFRVQMPERFFNVGIAEQNLVGIAAGLADDGWIPFATTFANFAAMRSCEFVRHHLGYMQQNVKIVGIGAGFAMGQFGNTHYSLEDVGVLRSIPNLTIVSPADCSEVYAAVYAIAASFAPTYLRLSGVPSMPCVDQEGTSFNLGEARVLRSGTDVTFIGTGSMVSVAVRAANQLTARGLSVGVVNMHTLKPIDELVLNGLVGQTAALVTIEEHSVIGGLGSAVAEVVAAVMAAPPLLRLGVCDAFPKVGSYEYALEQCGLVDNVIATAVERWVRGAA
ncbi:transketolase C-terminal domain-containing protein [uncultured Thiodictyon sp.]|uniref:transketolase family protein n=1 Tax=uncultured Thiodictyon sp. TaxID=1846217 RepID=UPI0025EEE2AF|nr:transketolase C-terminal domain-containing protein [uncultured Thiodictyon sp.]